MDRSLPAESIDSRFNTPRVYSRPEQWNPSLLTARDRFQAPTCTRVCPAGRLLEVEALLPIGEDAPGTNLGTNFDQGRHDARCSSPLRPPHHADRGDRAHVLDQHSVDGESALA